MAKIITIDIDKEAGTFTVDTAGFHGVGCKAVQDAFATMGTIKSEKPKPEFYKGQAAGNTLTNGQ